MSDVQGSYCTLPDACLCMDVDSEEDEGMVCSFCGGECEGVLHTHCIHEHGILRNFKK